MTNASTPLRVVWPEARGGTAPTPAQYPLDCPDGFTCTDVAELGARLCLPSATYLNTHCCADEQCASGKLCDPLTPNLSRQVSCHGLSQRPALL